MKENSESYAVFYERYAMSFLLVISGYFAMSIISSLIVSLFHGASDIANIQFLVVGIGKFILSLWIILVVFFYEKQSLGTIGLEKDNIVKLLIHGLFLFIIITVTFFAIFELGILLSLDVGIGFYNAPLYVNSNYFWLFILASAISEELFFRGFMITRLTFLFKYKNFVILFVSFLYGLLHYSLWGFVGALAFGVWGTLIAVYFVYVKQNIFVVSVAHLLSDIFIFIIISTLL